MARYDYADSRGLWLDVQLREIMDHVHEHLPELDKLCLRQGPGPRTLIVVASNCRYGCDDRQLTQDILAADIPSVDDVVAAAQERRRLRPEKPVSVGDDTNAKHAPPLSAAPVLAGRGRRLARVLGARPPGARGDELCLRSGAQGEHAARALAGCDVGMTHAAVEIDGITGLQAHGRIQARVEIHVAFEHEGVFLAGMADQLAALFQAARVQLGHDRDDALVEKLPRRVQV